jgi:hypothetical protein
MKFFKIVFAFLCLLCLFDMPYGYYQLFRIVATGSFFYLAYTEQSRQVWPIVWLVSGVLAQPFIKVALGRDIWNFVDVVWAIVLVASLFINTNKS